MLTTNGLRALIADHESDRVELTASTINTDKFGEAICAFLVVGVEDDGTVRGRTDTDALLRNLGALRSNVNIEPLPAMTVQKYGLPEGAVAVVEFLPSDLPPVRYKGRVWIRVGPSRLTEKRTALQRTFDVRPCHGRTLDELVPDLFRITYLPAAVDRAVIAENNRADKEQMASLRFYDLAADCPTNAGRGQPRPGGRRSGAVQLRGEAVFRVAGLYGR